MRIGYADLSLRPRDMSVAIEMIKLASRLGYRVVAIEYRDNLDLEELRRLTSDTRVRILGRVTVRGSTRADVRRALDKLGDIIATGVIVSVEAEALDAARYAGVNKRVHMVRVKPGLESVIDKSQLRLFESRGWGAFEIPLAYTLKPGGLSYISEVARRALRLNPRLVVVSDAEDIYTMWSPASIIGLLSSLGIKPPHVLSYISSSPTTIASIASQTTKTHISNL